MKAIELRSDVIQKRACQIVKQGGLEPWIESLENNGLLDMPLVEALVLGLLRQGIRKYLVIFGHGSTALGEVLRIYSKEKLIKCFSFRNEISMAHAATSLRWVFDEPVALVTSIGPGALQAMSASLAASSNGIGVYHIYGDETSGGEGYNMQQIPKPEQGLFGQLTAIMGRSYTLHTPIALREAMRQGAATVFHPSHATPFFINLPLNTQWECVRIRLATLPQRPKQAPLVTVCEDRFDQAIKRIKAHKKIAIKIGRGAGGCAAELRELVEKSGAVAVLSPGSTGALADAHKQNMHVGGSKGSISGNFAMDNAELLIVIGSRAVCQSDCSGIGWPRVSEVININTDLIDAHHYHNTTALVGDAKETLKRLVQGLDELREQSTDWLKACAEAKDKWQNLLRERSTGRGKLDVVWGREVLTQPQAIHVVAEFCKQQEALKFFDAGDVQANGFQIVTDDKLGTTFTESGASYMGFAVSALTALGIADRKCYGVAFTGDGSFMMNPQVLIDGVEHGAHATIALFDNRRMGAISALQLAQFGFDFQTNDHVDIDYVKLASAVSGVKALFGGYDRQSLISALKEAKAYKGISLIHIPVYFGKDPTGSMGAYGQWNVGNWSAAVQEKYLQSRI